MVISSFLNQFPRIAFIKQGSRNKLGSVDNRTSAYGQQEIYLFFLSQLYGLAQGLYRRIGFNAPELYQMSSGQCLHHLFIHSVFLHTSSAKGNHYAFRLGYQFT